MMAMALLVGIAVLGASLAQMHVRGADIASEFMGGDHASNLADAGMEVGLPLFRNSNCTLTSINHTIVGMGDYYVMITVDPDENDKFSVQSTGSSVGNRRILQCFVTCTPVSCPEGMPSEECAGSGGGGVSLVIGHCQQG